MNIALDAKFTLNDKDSEQLRVNFDHSINDVGSSGTFLLFCWTCKCFSLNLEFGSSTSMNLKFLSTYLSGSL